MTRIVCFGCIALAATFMAAGARAQDGPEGQPSRDERAREVRERKPNPSTTVGWVETAIGWERVDLTTVHVQRDTAGDTLTGDLVPATLTGPALSLGFGVRWLVLSFGARLGVAFFNDSSPDRTDGASQFYSIDAELGLRIPAGRLEPYLVLGAGYSVFGGLSDAINGIGQGLDIDGANVRLGLGVDYFVTRTWSIGARLSGELLFLARSGVPVRELARPEQVSTLGEAKARLLEGDGSSAGTAVTLTIGPGLHF